MGAAVTAAAIAGGMTAIWVLLASLVALLS